MKSARRQSTQSVLMIRPSVFYSNAETALTNEFQKQQLPDNLTLQKLAVDEFDAVVETMRGNGVHVVVVQDTALPETPDAVFPNNWLTTHDNGVCVMYPMQPQSRRAERRIDVIEQLRTVEGFGIRKIIDWSDSEAQEKYLEGTGSMVLDRLHHVAYAGLSARTDIDLLHQFCEYFDYQPMPFHAVGESGKSIYHTNVMMCIGSEFALVCADAIKDQSERKQVVDKLREHREVIEISYAQMAQFAGNMLELRNQNGAPVLAMSERAEHALTDEQKNRLQHYVKIVSVPITHIEDASGGSIRCMMAELFLPLETS